MTIDEIRSRKEDQTFDFVKNVAVNTGNVAVNAENVAVNAGNVAVNTKFLANRLGISRKTIQRELTILQEKNFVYWVGADKNGHWEIVNHQPSNN